jgi:hypothetical protein
MTPPRLSFPNVVFVIFAAIKLRMSEVYTNEMIYKLLEEVHAGQEMTAKSRVDILDRKLGSVATTVVSLMRELNDLKNDVDLLRTAFVDRHEKRLGVTTHDDGTADGPGT